MSALSVLSLALSVTSCSDGGDGAEVRFGYIGDYNGASLLAIAQEQGYWAEAGLSPELKIFTNGPLQVRALGAGDLDFGYIGPGAFWLPASGQIDAAGIWYPLIGTSIKPKVPDLVEPASTRDFPDRSFPTAFVAGRQVDDALTTTVISVLQKANDYRAEHPDEAIAESAALLKVDAETVKADAANVETMTTADLVTRTEDGTVAGWLGGMADFFVGTGQLKSAPDPTTYYTGDLYTGASRR